MPPMVNLTRIYTRTGDLGSTHLGDFTRTSKTDPRLAAYADANEANAALGIAIAAGQLDDDVVALKRRAMACHASQTDDIGMMLSLPPGMFRTMFGREYFVEPGVPGPMRRAWPF